MPLNDSERAALQAWCNTSAEIGTTRDKPVPLITDLTWGRLETLLASDAALAEALDIVEGLLRSPYVTNAAHLFLRKHRSHDGK